MNDPDESHPGDQKDEPLKLLQLDYSRVLDLALPVTYWLTSQMSAFSSEGGGYEEREAKIKAPLESKQATAAQGHLLQRALLLVLTKPGSLSLLISNY